MSRSVVLDGRVLTWRRLEALLEEDAHLSPVVFDVARDLPLIDAQQLQAWLVRRGIRAELRRPVAIEAAVHSSQRGDGARAPVE